MTLQVHRLLVIGFTLFLHTTNVFNPALFYDISQFGPDLSSFIFVYAVTVLLTSYDFVPEFFQTSSQYIILALEVLGSTLVVNAALVFFWLPMVAAMADEWVYISEIIRVLEVVGLGNCPLYLNLVQAYKSPTGLKLTCIFVTLFFSIISMHTTNFLECVFPEYVFCFGLPKYGIRRCENHRC